MDAFEEEFIREYASYIQKNGIRDTQELHVLIRRKTKDLRR